MPRRRLLPHTDSVRVQFVVGLSTLLGLVRLLESENRYRTVAYVAAKSAMPIHAWGAMFLTFGVMTYIAWRVQRPATSWRDPWWWPLRVCAALGGFVWLLWGVLSAESAAVTGASSYAGALLYGGYALIHMIIVFKGR